MKATTTALKATCIWLTLMVLSGISAYIGEFGQMDTFILGAVIIALVIKGQLIVDYFMDLRHVKMLWRLALSGFCIMLGIIIFITYFIATTSK